MKKLLFLLAFAALLSGCSKDETPDPNAPTGLPKLPDPNDVCSCMNDVVFMKYCYDNFDANGDGRVSRNEANSVTEIDLTNSDVKSITGIGYFSNLEKVDFLECGQLRIADLSNNLKISVIGEDSFRKCNNLTHVILPNSVTSIGDSAFSGCSSLTSIVIPDGVTEIGDNAFCRCNSLTSIVIPDGVTAIGDNAFTECSSLTSVIIGDGVTEIGRLAFFGCSSLTSIYCKPTVPPTVGDYVFANINSSAKFYVPNDSVEAYKTASGWSSYASRIIGYNFE